MTSKKGAVMNFPDIKSVQTQAAEWMATLDAENPSPQDLRSFKIWVNADPAHAQAFRETIAFYEEMNILTQAVLPKEAIKHQLADTQQTNARPAHRSWLRHYSIRPFGAFASLAILAIGVLLLTTMFSSQPSIYTTAVGEQKTIQLADKSTVLLNTNSKLEVNYSSDRRALRLVHGEAHFEVAHNPERPFEVTAGKGLVRAIGTAFTVHLRKVDVEVIVTEGTVELDHSEPQLVADNSSKGNNRSMPEPVETNVRVTAGNKLLYDHNLLQEVQAVVATQIEEQLSWHQGMLVFKAEPLEKVVAEVSRYTSLKIVIPERHAREMKVGGLFKVGDTESLFEALRDGFDIHVKEVSSDVVYLISNENR